jgi:hypothetical protein
MGIKVKNTLTTCFCMSRNLQFFTEHFSFLPPRTPRTPRFNGFLTCTGTAKRLFLKGFFTTETTKITEKKHLKTSVSSVREASVVNAFFFILI